MERGQVCEVESWAGVLGRIEIDLADLEESEVALAVLGRADLPLHRVAGAQAEAAYLAGAHIDVVRSGEKVRFRRAQEPEAVLQYLQHAAAVDRLVVFRQVLEDREHHRSEEHTSELQSLMRISYAVFCLTK